MKKFGIETKETDHTIGNKGRYYNTDWFDTEEERDKKYDELTKPVSERSTDILINLEMSYSPYIDGDEETTFEYKKVEMDE